MTYWFNFHFAVVSFVCWSLQAIKSFNNPIVTDSWSTFISLEYNVNFKCGVCKDIPADLKGMPPKNKKNKENKYLPKNDTQYS